MNSGQPLPPPRKIQVNPSAENKGQLFNWKLRPTFRMNSGQPPLPQEGLGELFSWILRPTLQLKIKANSSTEN